jgi:HK97 family phage portal protein
MVARVLARVFTAVGGSFYWAWSGTRDGFHRTFQEGTILNTRDEILQFSAVFACVTGIASDIAKLRIKLCENKDGIWTEITQNQPWLTVLRKPNFFQNRIQFSEQYGLSKLLAGNTYVLKGRDGRGVVNALYVLDPTRIYPLVADNGDVYYQLTRDPLSRKLENDIVPAREIIHDRTNCLYHPLVGISPLMACALSATVGSKIQNDSVAFFANRSMPGGVLTAPGHIGDDTAERLKTKFEENFSGDNAGRIAVLGDSLKFEAMRLTAEASQLAEQFKISVEDVARAFHYPLFKLGGPVPTLAGNIQTLTVSYFTDCLQILIESMELCLDEGLELPNNFGTELDLDNLLRMDTTTLYKTVGDAIGSSLLTPNEGRFKINYEPVEGGDSPMIQQQNYSLAALAKRDAREDPFATAKPEPPKQLPAPDPSLSQDEMEILFESEWRKELVA